MSIAQTATTLIRNQISSYPQMGPTKVALAVLVSMVLLCASTTFQEYPKIKVADGYVQVDKVEEASIFLEVSVYNATTEYLSGIVTVMKSNNLSDNQKVIKIAPGKTESVMFPKKDKNTIVTWEYIKLHSFSKIR